VIGLSADDRAIPTEEERTFALIPETKIAVESALQSSKEIAALSLPNPRQRI